jgi:hypothetical protein
VTIARALIPAAGAALLLAAVAGSVAATRNADTPEPAALAAADEKPSLTLSDTATLPDADPYAYSSVAVTVTLTCVAGYTAFGSVAVTHDDNAQNLAQPQGYSGLLRVPCTGQPQELRYVLTSYRTPFPEGPALARAGFTLNLCNPGCQWDYTAKAITIVRAAATLDDLRAKHPNTPPPAATPHDSTAPGEGGHPTP